MRAGTGNAFHTDGRGSQAIWCEAGELCFLVDLGPTALAGMERWPLLVQGDGSKVALVERFKAVPRSVL